MILYSLRTKVLALVGGGLLVATCGIAYLAHVVMERMIDRSQQVVYQNELDHSLLLLSQYYTELLNTYQEEVYRDQFQEEALRIIRQNHLVDADDNVYPVILDATGKVLLHPRLPVGDSSLIGLDFIQAMLQSPSGHFKYRYQGEDKWLIFAHFKPWNWVVGYSLKQSYMYADLASFHRILPPVIVLALFTVALVLLYGLKRFLQPIISLTRSAGFIAAGDFSQPIVAGGRDEISVLAGSFETMRKAVEQTIRNMEQQRRALEIEVRERQRAEYQAQAAEDRLRVILDSVADVMLVTDLELRVVTFNPAAQKVFPAVAVGKRMGEIFQGTSLEEELTAIVQGSQDQCRVEWSHSVEGGGSRVYEANSAAIHEPGGQLVGVVTIFRDITKAKDLDRLKSEFLSTAAHELRTPLAVIQGFSELMASHPETSMKERRERLDVILQRCQDLESLIEDLLDVSRIEAGQVMHLSLEELYLYPLVGQVVENFQRSTSNYQFRVESPDFPLQVCADGGKVQRILENLLSNASKFSPPGSCIDISFATEDGYAWVLVKDSGIGIPEDKQAQIFEKFYRVNGSDTAPRGLGLGLYLVQNLVTAHGGQLRLESRPGRGSTFAFSLALTQGESG